MEEVPTEEPTVERSPAQSISDINCEHSEFDEMWDENLEALRGKYLC